MLVKVVRFPVKITVAEVLARFAQTQMKRHAEDEKFVSFSVFPISLFSNLTSMPITHKLHDLALITHD